MNSKKLKNQICNKLNLLELFYKKFINFVISEYIYFIIADKNILKFRFFHD